MAFINLNSIYNIYRDCICIFGAFRWGVGKSSSLILLNSLSLLCEIKQFDVFTYCILRIVHGKITHKVLFWEKRIHEMHSVQTATGRLSVSGCAQLAISTGSRHGFVSVLEIMMNDNCHAQILLYLISSLWKTKAVLNQRYVSSFCLFYITCI